MADMLIRQGHLRERETRSQIGPRPQSFLADRINNECVPCVMCLLVPTDCLTYATGVVVWTP